VSSEELRAVACVCGLSVFNNNTINCETKPDFCWFAVTVLATWNKSVSVPSLSKLRRLCQEGHLA